MAKKRKAAPKKKKTQSKKKKSISKRKKGLKRILASGPVGVISSIDCGQSLKDALESGMAYGGVGGNPMYKCNSGYKPNKLSQAVQQLNAGASVIISAGGQVVYDVVNTVSSKPFLCLSGATPPNTSPNFRGGVNLQ